MPRHAHIEIDPRAITDNVRAVRDIVAPAELCAVVKADGYGHGSATAARAAILGGATRLAVALVEEGHALREAGIDVPILVLSEPPPDVMEEAYRAGLTPTVYSARGIVAAREVAASAGTASGAGATSGPWGVHLKIDTGMHRVGVDAGDALGLAAMIVAAPGLELAGTFTHLAVADEPDRFETAEQLESFNRVLADMESAGIDPGLRHAANSAAALRCSDARFDMVRIGIAMYGYSPFGAGSPEADWLEPAMSLVAEVTHTRNVGAGEGVSYGLRHRFDRDVTTAIVPLGYADGVDRRFGSVGGQILIGGSRHSVRGVVTMDQLIVEVSDGCDVRCGDDVVLIGAQGDEAVTVYEWAELLDTISYEIVCRFGARVPRVVMGGDGNDDRGDTDEVSRDDGARDQHDSDSDKGDRAPSDGPGHPPVGSAHDVG